MKACPHCKERFGDADDFCPHHGVRLVPIVTTDKADRTNYDRLIGKVIDGRYVIDGKLGEGGMGVVFRAHHKVIEKAVAIKVLRADLARDPSVVQRFQQEAKAASRIGHAHIVDVIDFGTLEDGAAFTVMELIDGKTLARVLREETRLPLSRALPIVIQMARALGAAHEKGIVHRDLKPDNVFLVTRDGRPDQVKVVDFGIAKMLAQSTTNPGTPRITRAGTIFGTPDYMAPEQAAGRIDIDQRVDIYSLGTILYELIVGHVPHCAENPLSVLTMQLLDPIIPPTQAIDGLDLSPAIEHVILTMLAKERDERYRSMPDVVAALEEAAGDVPLSTEQGAPAAVPVVFPEMPSVPPPTSPSLSGLDDVTPPPRSRGRLALWIAAPLLVTAAFAVWLFVRRSSTPAAPGPPVTQAPPDRAMAAAQVVAVTDAAPPLSPADAAVAVRGPPQPQRPLPPPRHETRPMPKPTHTVTIVTDPRDGVIVHQGRELADGQRIQGVEGQETVVTCKILKHENGRVRVVFDADKTVVCKMSELKDPFGSP